MRVVMVASECEPFAKTGGLGDVVDSLARSLGRAGHAVDVFLPRYRGVPQPGGPVERRTIRASADGTDGPGGRARGRDHEAVILTGDAGGYRIRLVDVPALYDRAGLYGDSSGEFGDNGERFAVLGRAALEAVRTEGAPVGIVHGHDWQGVPAVLSLRSRYGEDPFLAGAASVLTCHNLAYHGWVPHPAARALDLPAGLRRAHGVDLLHQGIARADLVNTVSPTYARESRRPEFGAGLDEVIRTRGDRYTGILNGIDPQLWDPATDGALAAPYSTGDTAGKRACRRDLAARVGLTVEDDGPVFAAVARADWQKGMDLISGAAAGLVETGAGLVVLSTGDDRQLDGLRAAAAAFPGRAILLDTFDRMLARRIYGGSDVLLMPSRFEPCGLSQMIALRYGTLPLVRRTGGLADTVIDADEEPEIGNGFVFDAPEVPALAAAARRATAAFGDRPRWSMLVARAMRADFTWERSVGEYVALYERAVVVRREDLARAGPGNAALS